MPPASTAESAAVPAHTAVAETTVAETAVAPTAHTAVATAAATAANTAIGTAASTAVDSAADLVSNAQPSADLLSIDEIIAAAAVGMPRTSTLRSVLLLRGNMRS